MFSMLPSFLTIIAAAPLAQGYNLLSKGVFDAAARCFERAGDAARAQARVRQKHRSDSAHRMHAAVTVVLGECGCCRCFEAQ